MTHTTPPMALSQTDRGTRLRRLRLASGGALVVLVSAALVATAVLAPLAARAAPLPLPATSTQTDAPSVSDAGVAGLLSDVTQTQALPAPVLADAPATTALDAALRFRASLPRNLSNLQTGEDAARRAIFHRERLGARFAQGPIDAHVQLQASGAFGDSGPGTSVLPAVGLQQGVVRIAPASTPWRSADMGRMVLDYGAGRMIGDDDFNAIGNAFDGIRAQLRYQQYLAADLLVVKLRHNPAYADQDRTLLGAYLTGRPHQKLSADLYFLYLVDGQPTGDSKLLTMGSRLEWRPTLWLRAELEGAVQVGEDDQADRKNTKSHVATAAFAQVDVSWHAGKTLWTLSPLAQSYSGEPVASGNKATSTAWKPLYPSLEKVVGLLQLFRPTNLMQEGVTLDVEFLPELAASVDVRGSFSHDNAPLPGFNEATLTGDGSWRWLGTETDLRVRWRVLRSSDVLLAGGLFAPSKSVQALVGKELAGQAMLQWTSKF